MTRTKSLMHLARSASKCNAADLSCFIPSRLLSNSQASTSAASDKAGPGGPSAGRRNPRQSDTPNRRSASGSQRDPRSDPRGTSRAPTDRPRGDPGSFASGPSPADQISGDSNNSEASPAHPEPEVGYVEDGAYPYAASEVEVNNYAPSTETGWEFLGSVDEQAITWFGMDFTRGTLPEVERNALLSNEAKEMMYQMHKHDNERYSHVALASIFQIRQQRVMAILALKGMEHGAIESLVKDPFWIRPDKDAKGFEAEPDISMTLEKDTQDDKSAAKADQEREQQLLQDIHQESQRSTAPEDEPGDSNDPKDEGVERYLLSNPDYLPYLMEHELWECHEPHGTGERHVKFIPRYPKFEFFEDDRAEAIEADKEAVGGKANIERPVLSFWEDANRIQAEEEEKHLVREFEERLKYNLQQTGSKISRRSRAKDLPSRPKAGWSMVVQDVSEEGAKKQFVALPDGRSRRLTADEEVYLERMKPKRRKRII
ncbi:hypothetical protein WJX79_001826 [Trebouxia sp. C0005]